MASGFDRVTTIISDMQRNCASRSWTAVTVLQTYLAQIERLDSYLHVIIELTPKSLLKTAQKLDDERKATVIRSPLHGIPILVKVEYPRCSSLSRTISDDMVTQDNIATHPDLGVASTTGGCFGFVGSRVAASAPAVEEVGYPIYKASAGCMAANGWIACQGWGDYPWKGKFICESLYLGVN